MDFDRLWKAKGLWLRILFCWALVSTFPFFDEVKQYDLRFGLRGNQSVAKSVVVVYFDQDDWNEWTGGDNVWARPLKDAAGTTDSSFWRAQTWNDLLGTILKQNPKMVGVTFFINPSLPKPDETYRWLYDPRLIWAAQLDNEGRPVVPLMANTYGYNLALVDLREDEDHILRRFSAQETPLPHMALKLAESEGVSSLQELNSLTGENKIINFRGTGGAFPTISALAVLEGHVRADFFKDKIVVVGSNSVPAQQYQTPLGRMSRADVFAQIIDNVVEKRWITRLSPLGCSLYLLVILLTTVAILTSYPQSITIVSLLWLGLGTTALSIWVFDTFNFWIPAFSPLALGLVSYVIFISYQLAMKENQTWRLQQEKQLLSELDQLRNNFVSLISHDLKTPIAKIQAICDRLLSGSVATEVRDGLRSLRKESVELHRYIQSILQISRLESNKVQLRKEATDLNEVVEKVVGQVRPLFSDKHQRLDLELEPMFSIEIDSVLIQEVVLNLIENAVKYTPNQGRIEVRTQEVDDRVIFAVKDTGPGIPEDDREHLFEKFFRGQAQHSNIKGTGLGLYLVKYFIELHGGEVFLESEIGKGTRVGFTLPLEA